ncbi:MAG: 50S ribosomal protein L14e [Candidatus Lokiarchaeota archaeon]|nr:50S ribosomal protein L14e [Candidatus Lokiarchaeota archaeon]
MGVYDIGQVCVKLLGREAGYLCTIVEVIDKNFALVEGLKVKRRRCNFKHLSPTKHMIEIKKGANKKAIEEAIEKAKLKEKFETKNVPKLQL